MWKFLALRCKPRDNAIHPTAWVFCGFGFGFFIQTYFHELALASFSSLTSKNSNFGINVPVFVLLIFVKKKKTLQYLWTSFSMFVSQKLLDYNSGEHFGSNCGITICCKEQGAFHSGWVSVLGELWRPSSTAKYFHCSVHLEDLRINTAFFIPHGRL